MVKIAACLIVRDAAECIEACLETIRQHVDEVNVYDTGSTDDTLAILDRLSERTTFTVDFTPLDADEPVQHEFPLAPIRVEQGEWRHDFAWAREQSFAMCSDDVTHILWLDDDDEIVGAERLRQMAAAMPEQLDGYVFFYDYARDEHGATTCTLWRERLLRRSAGYEWRGAVHEVLVPPEGRMPRLMMVPPEQVRYVHRRPAERYDPARNLEILKAAERRAQEAGEPLDPRTLAYLGTEHMAKALFAEAIPYLQAYLEHPEANWPDERSQVRHKLAACLRYLGHFKASVEVEIQAIAERPDWAENEVGLAQAYASLGEWSKTEVWAKRALEHGMPQSMLILNPLEFTLVPLLLIADACREQGRFDEATSWMEKALEVMPSEQIRERLSEFSTQRFEAELVAHTLALRETLVRYDENLKALRLMENVPYLIAEHPAIVKARADQRTMMRHALDPADYIAWYEDVPKESTVPDEWVPEAGDHIERARFLLETAQRFEAEHGRKPRMLDLGCNDAWLAGYLWTAGSYVCDGVELNKASVEKAQGRIERFGIPGQVWQGDIFDAPHIVTEKALYGGYDVVSCFEVFEHVLDEERLLDVMESLLSQDGVACITTPNGAFQQGHRLDWNTLDRQNHFRAVPAHELAEKLNRRGEIEDMRVHQDDRLTFAAWRPRRKRGKAIFFNGGSVELWSPFSIHKGGIDGSETALIQVASRLAQAGVEVKVYAHAEPGLYAGALWRPWTAFDPSEECDLLVVSRIPAVFDQPLAAKRRALWCHDHSYAGQMTEQRVAAMTDVVVLSDWQRERFGTLYPFAADKLRLIRNGITYTDPQDGSLRFPDGARGFDERRPRCIYSSSADRGLDTLLTLWPKIREQVPEAELYVYYGWETFDRFAITNPQLLEFKARCLSLVEEQGGEEGGVFMHGRVGQKALTEAMQGARVWSYPSYFQETSCIGAMEARASGLAIVTSDLAALSETVGEHGILLPPEPVDGVPDTFVLKKDYGAKFTRQVVRLLTDEVYWTRWHRKAREGAETLDWQEQMPEWLDLVVGARQQIAA